ncbi:MAG: 4Fe-4S binding protein, partial [Planctomycetota bacterium]|nr:4Fe-4S binding protein [Planctomycetota bacterium]
MKRGIIEIDESKCSGCGLCAGACREGAIEMAEGKARLRRADYCDGLGNCLPVCPTGAISLTPREAEAYNAEKAARGRRTAAPGNGCPGSNAHSRKRAEAAGEVPAPVNELRQWPVQIRLVPVKAPYFNGANLLIAADCAAYARAGFHAEFMRGRITLIGCP